MGAQLEKSNLKREYDEDNNEQNKRKKLEVPEEVEATINLTDVNDDCLVQIFKHLKLPDLINVADTCKRFQAGVQTTFVDKYRGREILLDPRNTTDLMSCLKVLRHFGVKISKLNIYYGYLGEDQKAALAWYMNEYCVDSLIEFQIWNASNGLTTNWTKPFENVESIEFGCGDLGDLSEWFPNLRHLVLSWSYQGIKSTLPYLKELHISISEYEDGANVAEMLRLNQHLQILRFSGYDCDMKFLESVSGYLQSIKLLDISCDKEFFNTEGGSVHLQSVNELHINLLSFDSLSRIPFKFDQLEKVQLTIGEFNLNDNFKTFLKANSSLKKMNIYIEESTPHSVEQIKTDIAELSPSLEVYIVIPDDDVSDEEDD